MDVAQQIKEKLDIVEIVRGYITLIPAGKNFKAVCPFHKEKTPSFIVSPDRQTWHCFGQCNEGGDVISFVMKYENVEFYEALKELAEKAGVELRQFNPAQEKEFGVLYDINEAAGKFYEQHYENSKEAKDFLRSRGVQEETREQFGIGFAPNEKDSLAVYLIHAGYAAGDIERAGLVFKTERGTYMDRFRGRIMFPLRNTFGKTVAFSGRILPQYENENTGKYINSPETPIFNKSRLLYAFDTAKQEIRKAKRAIVVEGQMDLIMLFQEGIRNVVATSGTALTQFHLNSIKKITDELILGFDTDEAGKTATERAIDMAHLEDFNVKIFSVPEGKDAAEFIQKNPGRIRTHMDHNLQNPFDFYFETFFANQYKDDTKRATRALLQKILMLASPIDQNAWLKSLSAKTGLPDRVLYDELGMIKKNRSVNPEKGSIRQEPDAIAKGRLEKIAERIELICIAYPNLRGETESFSVFFPKQPFEAKTAGLLEMQSSIEFDERDEEAGLHEIRFLLKELKNEFLKTEGERLISEIKFAEQEKDERKKERLLKEFDETSKLRDNS